MREIGDFIDKAERFLIFQVFQVVRAARSYISWTGIDMPHASRLRASFGFISVAFLLVAALIPLSASFADQAPSGVLEVGAAKVDMTLEPNEVQFFLTGYGGRKKVPAAGVLDHVYARAVVLSDSRGRTVALVSADLCYITGEVRDSVIERLASFGFDTDNLLIAATHTHSSIGGYDRTFLARKLFGEFDERVFEHVVSSIASAVIRAKESMRPARMAVATGILKGMNRNRRNPAFDIETGRWDPSVQASPEEYPTDERMTVVLFEGTDGAPVAVLIRFTAHPTVLSLKNHYLSADFPGVLCGRVERALGGGAVAMFLNGSLGDVAPIFDWEDSVEKEIEHVREYGNELAARALELLQKAEFVPSVELDASSTAPRLPAPIIRPLLRLRVPVPLTKMFYTEPYTTFQVIRIGEVVFLAIPGEPTTEFGRELESICPREFKCMVVAPANGYLGYFVTPEQYKQGGYEANVSFFGPRAVDWVRYHVSSLLAEVLFYNR